MTAEDITWLTLAALLGLAVYAFVCRFWPWTACRKCEGKGKFRSPSGKNWRRCPRCKGSASKERMGAVVLRVLLRRRGR